MIVGVGVVVVGVGVVGGHGDNSGTSFNWHFSVKPKICIPQKAIRIHSWIPYLTHLDI